MSTSPENISYKQAYEETLVHMEALSQENKELKQKYEQLQFEIDQLKKLIFGSRREKFVSSESSEVLQPILFEVPEIEDAVSSKATVKVSYERNEKHPSVEDKKERNCFPEKLRREDIVINPPGTDISTGKKIGEDITETLAFKPAELYVKRVIRPKYLLITEGGKSIVQGKAPERSFEKSHVDPSIIAQIIIDKYIDHLPLDRQIKRYERLGYRISDSTIGNWVKAASAFLSPLYDAHKKEVLESHYLHVDETTIKVLDTDKKNATHQGYYWVYQCNASKLVLFDYRRGRGREGPKSILKDFKGVLQTDGYQAYNEFEDYEGITMVNCMAHARRKFHEAQANDAQRASHALTEIQKLYAIERHIVEKKLKEEEKKQYRKEHAIEILNALQKWMQQAYTEVLPSSAIGKALAYSLVRWYKLSYYAHTDFIHLDNNPVENSIRPVAVGRKNYLFAGSHDAAQRAAMIYSLLASCKNYNVNPFEWLNDILTRIAGTPINQIRNLLPQNWKQQNP